MPPITNTVRAGAATSRINNVRSRPAADVPAESTRHRSGNGGASIVDAGRFSQMWEPVGGHGDTAGGGGAEIVVVVTSVVVAAVVEGAVVVAVVVTADVVVVGSVVVAAGTGTIDVVVVADAGTAEPAVTVSRSVINGALVVDGMIDGPSDEATADSSGADVDVAHAAATATNTSIASAHHDRIHRNVSNATPRRHVCPDE